MEKLAKKKKKIDEMKIVWATKAKQLPHIPGLKYFKKKKIIILFHFFWGENKGVKKEK